KEKKCHTQSRKKTTSSASITMTPARRWASMICARMPSSRSGRSMPTKAKTASLLASPKRKRLPKMKATTNIDKSGGYVQQDTEKLKKLWDYNLTNHKPTPEGIRKIEALRSAA